MHGRMVAKTARVIAVYRQPADARKFDSYYASAHTPLVKKIPGLRRLEVAKVTGAASGTSDVYQVAQLVFDAAAARERALASPEAKAVIDDLPKFTGGIATIYFGEGEDL